MRKRTQRILVGAGVLIAVAAAAMAWHITSGGPRLYQGKTALEWTERLSRPASSERTEAVEALREGGDTALEELTKALERQEPLMHPPLRWLAGKLPPKAATFLWRRFQLHESRQRRVAAANAIAALRPSDSETVSRVMIALADPDPPVHYAASRALSAIGAPALPALTNQLNSNSGPPAKLVVYTLGQMRHAGAPAIPQLVARLRTAGPDLIEPLQRALAAVGSAAVPHLIPLLQDPDPVLRLAAIQTLTFAGPAGWPAADALAERFEAEPPDIRRAIGRGAPGDGPSALRRGP